MIDSNEGFTDLDFPGSGSKADPYIIEGLNITADGYCISIFATSVFFIVKDCYLKLAKHSPAVQFSPVTSGCVERCKIAHSGDGLRLVHSSDWKKPTSRFTQVGGAMRKHLAVQQMNTIIGGETHLMLFQSF